MNAHTGVLRLGWDVGGWTGSGDALYLIAWDGGQQTEVGRSGPRNLAGDIQELRGYDLIDRFLYYCGYTLKNCTDLVIAIDAPLGWPDEFARLISARAAEPSMATPPYGCLIWRKTELRFSGEAKSAVTDRIGSNSTKALAFLRAVGFERELPGVWSTCHSSLKMRAIEAFPRLLRRSPRLLQTLSTSQSTLAEMKGDLADALWCAVLGHAWADLVDACEPIPIDASVSEGWIVVPRDVAPARG